MENDPNRIINTSPRFKAPLLEPIMEDQILIPIPPDSTAVAIAAIPISTVPAARLRGRRRGRARASSPRRSRTTNAVLASMRGIATSDQNTWQNLRPHRINIYRGQDVVEKIMSFCKEGHRDAIVLSASGNAVISTVTLSNSNSPAEVSFEGCFEVMSLTGRFIDESESESEEVKGRLHLTVSLVLQDMSVVGGIINGPLIASSSMSILMGTFNNNPLLIATNLTITEPSTSHFDASASSSKSNIN